MDAKHTVLVVEEKAENAKAIAHVLEKEMPGTEVITSLDPAQAMKTAKIKKIDVLVCNCEFGDWELGAGLHRFVDAIDVVAEKGGRVILHSAGFRGGLKFSELLERALVFQKRYYHNSGALPSLQGMEKADFNIRVVNNNTRGYIRNLAAEIKEAVSQKSAPWGLPPRVHALLGKREFAAFTGKGIAHIMSPIEKQEGGVERELRLLEGKLREAHRQGDWPKRELNNMMDKHRELTAILKEKRARSPIGAQFPKRKATVKRR